MQPWLRIVLAILGVALFALVLVLLIRFVRNRTSEPQTASVVRVWRLEQDVDVVLESVNEFEKSTGTDIVFSKQTYDGYEIAALKSLAAKQGPDIWSIPSFWIANQYPRTIDLPETLLNGVQGNNPVALSEAVKLDYPEGISKLLFDDSGKHVVALPSVVDTYRIIYNPAIFEAAYNEYRIRQGDGASEETLQAVRRLLGGPGKTWDEVVEQVPYLTIKSGAQVSRSAISLGSADNIPYASDLVQFLIHQNGQEIVSPDRNSATFHLPITSPAGIELRPGEEALRFYAQFSSVNSSAYTWNASMPDAIQAFGEGKLAMMIVDQNVIADVATRFPRLEFFNAPMPQISVGPGSQPKNLIVFMAEVVTPTTPNRQAALNFLVPYTSSTSTAAMASERGVYTPYKSRLESMAEGDPLAGQILTGVALYKRQHEQFDQAFQQMIRDVTQNGLSAADALTKGSVEINRILKLPVE